MLLRSVLSLSAFLLVAQSVCCASEAATPTSENSMMKAENEATAPTVSPVPTVSTVSNKESEPVAKRLNAGSGTFMGEHAPLALFSLGSLAVGGIFYAIHVSTHDSKVDYTAGDKTSLTNAVGAAGLTALLAAGSYFYFAHKEKAMEADPEPESGWDAQVSGGLAPDGGVSVGAKLTFPLASLSR